MNRASNSTLEKIEKYSYDYFQEKYLLYKSKKKLIEKNKDKTFQKLYDTKGIINIEGYGEDGKICPICLDNKKSILCLPCRHFFCRTCIDKLLIKANCPICRTQIRIIFDIYSKLEKFVQPLNNEESESSEELSFSFMSEEEVDLESEDSQNNNYNNEDAFSFANLSLNSHD